jgi:hypothetical protein
VLAERTGDDAASAEARWLLTPFRETARDERRIAALLPILERSAWR